VEGTRGEIGVTGRKVDANILLKASAFPSAVMNCSLLWIKVSGKEEPVVFVLKNLQKCFGLSLAELANVEIDSRFFILLRF
jgi:hypothetical protein